MAIWRTKQSFVVRGHRSRTSPHLFAPFLLGDQGKRRVVPGMVADDVAFGRNPSNEFTMPVSTRTNHEESRPRAMGSEDVEEARGVNRIRPVVECQRQHRLLCRNVYQCFKNTRHSLSPPIYKSLQSRGRTLCSLSQAQMLKCNSQIYLVTAQFFYWPAPTYDIPTVLSLIHISE